MDLELLKKQVYEANMELFRRNMIIYTSFRFNWLEYEYILAPDE